MNCPGDTQGALREGLLEAWHSALTLTAALAHQMAPQTDSTKATAMGEWVAEGIPVSLH